MRVDLSWEIEVYCSTSALLGSGLSVTQNHESMTEDYSIMHALHRSITVFLGEINSKFLQNVPCVSTERTK